MGQTWQRLPGRQQREERQGRKNVVCHHPEDGFLVLKTLDATFVRAPFCSELATLSGAGKPLDDRVLAAMPQNRDETHHHGTSFCVDIWEEPFLFQVSLTT
jgi:hypothetical protein